MGLDHCLVAVEKMEEPGYCLAPPFDPPNPVYALVSRLFQSLGLDAGHCGTPEWNPLGELIRPGHKVVIKPNLVTDRHFHERLEGDRMFCSSTHGSVLRPIIDFALKAAGPEGRVTLIDSPMEGTDLDVVTSLLGIPPMLEALRSRGRQVDLLDLRDFRVIPMMILDDARIAGRSFNLGLLVKKRLPGDPLGHVVIDLGNHSHFKGLPRESGRLSFHRSHRSTPVAHHTDGRHEYSIPRTLLDADVFINVPKLKTHKKTGVTLSLKSVIGLTNCKYWLPHFTAGAPPAGDEFPVRPSFGDRIALKLSRFPLPQGHSLIARAPRLEGGGQVIGDGGWPGNDTLWRTILDMNRILFYADQEGRISTSRQRRYMTVIDGIIAGEGEGPLGSVPKRCGALIGGLDPVAADRVACSVMGIDPARIPLMVEASRPGDLPIGFGPPGEVQVRSGTGAERLRDPFRLPKSWEEIKP